MYLLDTDIVSESRKGAGANKGVQRFLDEAQATEVPSFISVVTLGELRRGIERLRHRNDLRQVEALEAWFAVLLEEYEGRILDFGQEEAQVWGKLRVPHPENAIDKQIAATAVTNNLTVVTRNTQHFESTGITVVNPFTEP